MAAQAFLYGGMAALDLVGGFFEAENIKQTAALNRDIAEMNAEFAELDAYDAEIDGYSQQAEYQKIIDDTLAGQQLALTAADVDVSYGSASEIQNETRFLGMINKLEIQGQAEAKAMGYEREARNYRFGADLNSIQAAGRAQQAQIGGIVNAAKTGATGYAKGAFKGGGVVRSDSDFTDPDNRIKYDDFSF